MKVKVNNKQRLVKSQEITSEALVLDKKMTVGL